VVSSLGEPTVRRNRTGLGTTGFALHSKSVLIDLAPGKRGQQFIGVFFFLQGFVQQVLIIAQLELPGERGEAPISRDLIVLELLRRGDQAGIT
jgi:hypothetical protein